MISVNTLGSRAGMLTLVEKSTLPTSRHKSVLKLHSLHHHNGRDNVNFTMKVTGTHTSSLDRQVTERVNIENFQGQILMNRRNELGGVRIDRMQYRRWGGH